MQGQELTSWKEIAGYLRVSVRTAQLWERDRGLPVRRLPGPRGRVIVSPAELDSWKAGVKSPAVEDPAPVRSSTWRRAARQPLMVAGLLVPVAFLAFALRGRQGNPVSYRVEQSALVVVDADGRELWRRPVNNLARDLYSQYRLVWIGDLDGDGRNEVLFAPRNATQDGVPEVRCYAPDGSERWRFVAGRSVRTRKESFSSAFFVYGLTVARVDRRSNAVVILGAHYREYPAQVALVSTGGRILREYWHPGHLIQVLTADFDHDGKDEIYVAGINNARRAATLIALDPGTMGGVAQEENQDYEFLGFSPARERTRIIFPRSCLTRNLPFNSPSGLRVESGGLTVNISESFLAGELYSGVQYFFGPDLRLRNLEIEPSYRLLHDTLEHSGVLDHAFTPKEAGPLSRIEYIPKRTYPDASLATVSRSRHDP